MSDSPATETVLGAPPAAIAGCERLAQTLNACGWACLLTLAIGPILPRTIGVLNLAGGLGLLVLLIRVFRRGSAPPLVGALMPATSERCAALRPPPRCRRSAP